MKKKTLSKDFGIFGDLSDNTAPAPEAEGGMGTPPTDISDDIFGIKSEEPAAPADEKPKDEKPSDKEGDTPPEGDPETPPADEDTPPTDEGEPTPEEEVEVTEEEILRLIKESTDWFDELEKSTDLTPEDKKKIQELSDINDELIAKNATLTRQLEAARETSNKTLEDGEWLRIYQPIIDKLEKDPQLMLFVKYMGTKNEAMKTRLTDIAKDLLYTLTWVDVYSLMDTQTKDSATALGSESEEAVPPAIDTPKEVTGQKYTRKKDPTFPL